MDEAILIDIAKRFHTLEDHIEKLNTFVVECRRNQWWPNRRKRDDEDWDETCDASEQFAEACRDDMNRMMDEIRKAKACA